MIVGNDISTFQGNIDFNTYKNNSNFVLIKASEGVGFVDPHFLRNQVGFRTVDLPRGYYHFARPDLGNSPQDEAKFFLKTVGVLQEGEVLCLDYEAVWNGDIVGWCKLFLDTIAEALHGLRPLIYLNQSLCTVYNWKIVAEASYGLWIAAYTYNPNNNTFQSGAWGTAAMQQWTNEQNVPGIAGNVDGDVFFGTVEQFKAYGYKIPVSPSASVSQSVSPSASLSASLSPSSSVSASASASPSPSNQIPPNPPQSVLSQLVQVINSQWNWFGANGWYRKLDQLRKILHTT